MKYYRNLVCLVAVLILPAFSQLSFANEAIQLVQKMSDAMRNLNYRGTFVYMHENQLESMSISHLRNNQGEKERLLSLNGEAREVIRDNKNLTCIWPSSRKVVVDSSRKNSFSPIFIPEDIDRISKFYNIRIVGSDRVAGQAGRIVHIDPKDEFRYGFKFWINEENGLMLKSSLINERDEYVEQIMFTQMEEVSAAEIAVNTVIPGLEDGYSLIRFHNGEEASSNIESDMSWRASNIPDGFWLESALKRKIPNSEEYIHQIIYTDGLASLSIFIEKENGNMEKQNASMGAVNAHIHMYKQFSVTAIGEVPAITVKTMAESVTLSN